MKAYTILLCLIVVSGYLTAQNIQPTRIVSQAYNGYADPGVDGLLTNQAGLYRLNGTSVTGSAIKRYFSDGLLELHLGGAFQLSEYTGGGIYVRRFGDDIFSEQTFGVAVGRQLFENFSMGIALEAYQIDIEGYGNEFQFNTQLGFQASLSKNVRIGSHMYLPLEQTEFRSYSNQATFNFDVSVDADDHLTLKGGVRKLTEQEFGIKAAIVYSPLDKVEIHLGMLTHPTQYSTGVGLDILQNLQLFLMGNYQSPLGWSSGINLQYVPKN